MNSTHAEREAAAAALGVVVGASTFLLVSVLGIFHVLLTNRRRQAKAQSKTITRHESLMQETRTYSELSSAASAMEGLPALTLRALEDAQASARRLRKYLNALAFALAFFVIFIAGPLCGIQIANQQPFWPSGVGFALLAPLAASLKADPNMPRQSRADMGSSATFMFPFMAGFLAFFAMYTARTPHLYGTCSTDDPACARAAWIFTALWGASSAATAIYCFLLLPVLYVTTDSVVPPVHVLLEQQRKVIATEPSHLHPAFLRTNPIYLLSGADTGYFAEHVRTALRRFARATTALALMVGPLMCAAALALDGSGVIPPRFTSGGLLPIGICITIWWPAAMLLLEAHIKASFQRILLRGETRRAAVLSGLSGSYSPSKALAVARATFRALPADALAVEDFVDTASQVRHRAGLSQALYPTPVPDPVPVGAGPTVRTGLSSQTVSATLGEVDGFICHSWHDDSHRQFDAFSRWVASLRDEGVTEGADRGRVPMCWFDRACVDESNVGQSLACLPVYLSGCRQLVVLAGETFSGRLWCAIELFVFIQMGARPERICCLPLSGDAQLHRQFERFSVHQTQCAKAEDKERLLTAVEHAFGGSTEPFDQLVRSVLMSALSVAARA